MPELLVRTVNKLLYSTYSAFNTTEPVLVVRGQRQDKRTTRSTCAATNRNIYSTPLLPVAAPFPKSKLPLFPLLAVPEKEV